MNILVINGSPKGEKSDTMVLTRAFLEGMGESYRLANVADLDIKPCLGCYSCWRRTPGECVHHDDMAELLGQIVESDLIIWSTPLYCYSVPSTCKAVIDRLLPLSRAEQYVDAEGRTHHPSRMKKNVKMLLISGCGFPDREGNFDGLSFMFRRMFGQNLPMILCVEAPLLGIAEARPVAEPYLAAAKRAGAECAKTGAISAQTQSILDSPMFPPDEYRTMAGRS